MNLLTGDWVLVSPHRLSRPWAGAEEPAARASSPHHDPDCPLCPGSLRAGGVRNPVYAGVHVFDNDFPALLAKGHARDAAPLQAADPIFVEAPETGVCRVICYTPDHAGGLSTMSPEAIGDVIAVWIDQTRLLAGRPDVGAVTIFENRGSMMGASNPHPHGQIWATSSVPNELAREDAKQRQWFETQGEPLLLTYLRRELERGERVILEGKHFVALVPFWAAWPFETLILPKAALSRLDLLSAGAAEDLARVLHRLTRAFDQLFKTPFPYSMGWHQAPPRTEPDDHFILHAHFFPPLLRSASVRKFMVGFELLAMPQRDLTPEAAAMRLRAEL